LLTVTVTMTVKNLRIAALSGPWTYTMRWDATSMRVSAGSADWAR